MIEMIVKHKRIILLVLMLCLLSAFGIETADSGMTGEGSAIGNPEHKAGESMEESDVVEEQANGDFAGEAETQMRSRQPAQLRLEEGRRTYDPEDTIYYKSYYDEFRRGYILNISYEPRIEMHEELGDYFVDGDIFYWEKLVAMFYDDRTIEMKEEELEHLFWEHGYHIRFHSVAFQDYHLRFVEITEADGLSVYPVKILMQTWDDEFIYLQDITSTIPRFIRNVMVVDRDGVWQIIVHSSGVSVDYIAEEELSFWEFCCGHWILVPMELEIDTSHAHIAGGLYADLNRDELFEVTFYRDGIAYRPSVQRDMSSTMTYTVRLGIMEIVEENRVFRLWSVYEEPYGRTNQAAYGGGYIQFEIK